MEACSMLSTTAIKTPLSTHLGHAGGFLLFPAHQRQDLSAEINHFFQIRPAHEQKLRYADAFVFHDGGSNVFRSAHQGKGGRSQTGNSSSPEPWSEPVGLVRFSKLQSRPVRHR